MATTIEQQLDQAAQTAAEILRDWTTAPISGRVDGEVVRKPQGRGEYLIATVSEHKGKHYAGIRRWYTDKSGELKPTQKGVTMPVAEFGEIEEMVAAIRLVIDGNKITE